MNVKVLRACLIVFSIEMFLVNVFFSKAMFGSQKIWGKMQGKENTKEK